MSVRADAVRNVIIWGNHSSTQFPDVAHAYVQQNGTKTPVYDAVQDDAWIKGDFIKVCCLFLSHFSPPILRLMYLKELAHL